MNKTVNKGNGLALGFALIAVIGVPSSDGWVPGMDGSNDTGGTTNYLHLQKDIELNLFETHLLCIQ